MLSGLGGWVSSRPLFILIEVIVLVLTFVSLGALVSLFCFIYEAKMNRPKMNSDEMTDVTLSCSDFCFRHRQ